MSLIKQDPNFTTATSGSGGGGVNKLAMTSSRSSSSSEGPDDPNDPSVGDSEFISDSFQPTNVSAEEVRKDMYKLGIHKTGDGKCTNLSIIYS